MGETREIRVPSKDSLESLRIETGHNHEAVVLIIPVSTNMLLFTPLEARSLGARLLELANHVDGGQGVS